MIAFLLSPLIFHNAGDSLDILSPYGQLWNRDPTRPLLLLLTNQSLPSNSLPHWVPFLSPVPCPRWTHPLRVTYPVIAPAARFASIWLLTALWSLPAPMLLLYPGPLNCNSSNMVYLFYCGECPNGNCVGETKTQFRLRFNNHKQTIRNKSEYHTVALHFNLPDHGLENLHCCLIRGGFKTDFERKSYEFKLINRLNTLARGLNRERSHLGAFTCLPWIVSFFVFF